MRNPVDNDVCGNREVQTMVLFALPLPVRLLYAHTFYNSLLGPGVPGRQSKDEPAFGERVVARAGARGSARVCGDRSGRNSISAYILSRGPVECQRHKGENNSPAANYAGCSPPSAGRPGSRSGQALPAYRPS
ncbi:hypothetical protein MAPG_08519 [Magnaporthiopsis poae ATCC 64411]|uniref:Uncharacterized protein n=1 Tax=Magnaporthiopsis poae (strain ATCC 64411 / 73-15) TaxID=644358 RepID=A0A0C4E7K6_MAGP6|nr:hypothetical protein MAPG_08519 [Magnaporthiopsis poae ATCC 64411]